jgi:signal transduction histidine kinase
MDGISAATAYSDLQPFFTTKGRNGTGLGLTICAEIIARHGGTLNFDTVTDPQHSGTIFRFFLPFHQSDTALAGTVRT